MALAQKLATAEFDESRGCLRVVASAPVPDADGEVIDPRVLRLDAYKANPVVLWAHDQQRFPIAKCEDPAGNFTCFVDDRGRLIQEWYFDASPEAQYVKGLYQRRTLRGASIGFLADGYKRVPATESAKRWGVGKDLRELTGGELRETSAVPVPSCPAALALGWIDAAAVPAVMSSRSTPALVTKSLSAFFGQATDKNTIPATKGAAMSQPTETPVEVKAEGDPKPEGDKPGDENLNEIKAACHSMAVKAVGDLFEAGPDDKESHDKAYKSIKVHHKTYLRHMKAMGEDEPDDDDKPKEQDVEEEKAVAELVEKLTSLEAKAARVDALEAEVESLKATVATLATEAEEDRTYLATVLPKR